MGGEIEECKAVKARKKLLLFVTGSLATVLKARCEHARAATEVEAAVWKHRDFMHVPEPHVD